MFLNYFEFNSNVKHQISGTAIGMKFEIQSWIWFRYIDDIFSFEQLVKKNLMIFWNNSSIFILI